MTVAKWNITDADVKAANAWLERATSCDYLDAAVKVDRVDLETICDFACSNVTLVTEPERFRSLRQYLLLEMGEAKSIIAWSDSKPTENPPEVNRWFMRLTRRGRMLVQHVLQDQYEIVLTKVM